MQGAIFCHPEKIVIAPLWDNPNITRNNKAIKKSVFPIISEKLSTIADLYYPGTDQPFSKHELEARYEFEISEESFWKYVISRAKY